jgi:hypothetical protein
MRKPLGCVFHFVLDSGLFFDFFLGGKLWYNNRERRIYKLDDGGRRDLSQSVLDRRDPFFFFLAYKV